MKRLLIIALIVVIVGLDALAMHDIIKQEGDLILEYAMVIASILILAFLAIRNTIEEEIVEEVEE